MAPTNTWPTTFTAPSNGMSAAVTAKVRDEKITINFEVQEPTGIKATLRGQAGQQAELFAGPYPRVAAGMFIDVVLQPTNVSFYRVEVQEPGEPTTATGYFTQPGVTPPSHSGNGADEWHPVDCDNKVLSPPLNLFDHAYDNWGTWPMNVTGTYTWPIHPVWRVGAGDTTSETLDGWTEQKFALTNGTMTIYKLGHRVIRGPNEPRGTAQ